MSPMQKDTRFIFNLNQQPKSARPMTSVPRPLMKTKSLERTFDQVSSATRRKQLARPAPLAKIRTSIDNDMIPMRKISDSYKLVEFGILRESAKNSLVGEDLKEEYDQEAIDLGDDVKSAKGEFFIAPE